MELSNVRLFIKYGPRDNCVTLCDGYEEQGQIKIFIKYCWRTMYQQANVSKNHFEHGVKLNTSLIVTSHAYCVNIWSTDRKYDSPKSNFQINQ